jgi:hypothetical protein
MAESDSERRIEHPNRKKASSQLTRLVVIVLLLASAGLVTIVTIGGWSVLAGAKLLQVVFIILYLVLAYFVGRWSRGVLPLIAALATLLLIFAAVSTPAWFDRAQTGFTDPALPSDLLGLITALIVPVQILLIAVAMSGFRQAWNVEVEHGSDDEGRGRDRGERDRRFEREEEDDRIHAGVRDDRPREADTDADEPQMGGGPHRAPEPQEEPPTRELPSRDAPERPPRPESGSGGASPAPA